MNGEESAVYERRTVKMGEQSRENGRGGKGKEETQEKESHVE